MNQHHWNFSSKRWKSSQSCQLFGVATDWHFRVMSYFCKSCIRARLCTVQTRRGGDSLECTTAFGPHISQQRDFKLNLLRQSLTSLLSITFSIHLSCCVVLLFIKILLPSQCSICPQSVRNSLEPSGWQREKLDAAAAAWVTNWPGHKRRTRGRYIPSCCSSWWTATAKPQQAALLCLHPFLGS